MATRSTIALEYPDGKIGQIYCHWDGYLSNNGSVLSTYWTRVEDINELILGGSLSSLGTKLGSKHDFDLNTNECTFYGRDRGEDDVGADFYPSFESYCADAAFEEFNYIFRSDGKWWVMDDGSNWVTLDSALAETLKD